MKNLKWILLIVAAFAIGYWSGGNTNESHTNGDTTAAQSTTWTCSMHANVKLPSKGQCPICFMDLIPLEAGIGSGTDPILEMSPSAEKLAEIMTTAVIRSEAFSKIRVTGKLDVDEAQVRNIASWMDGRIERLYVDFTGISVRKDDHLLDIYSPGLIAAQEEFLAAYQAGSGFGVSAAREKLRLLGVSKIQISNLEKSGKAKESLTIHTPISGVVIDKNAREGEYVRTGQHLFSVADLSQLWLLMDIFESEIGYLYLGQPVEFETTAYPGKTFNGTVAFIAPTLDPSTRTVKVRENVKNDADTEMNSETPGSMIDRLSINALKIYHMDEEVQRKEITAEHRNKCAGKLSVLQEQREDLEQCLSKLLADLSSGEKRLKVYRQMKMYNDESLNPVLYRKDELK